MNGEATGLILRFTRGTSSGLRSSVQNLRDLELDPKLFGLEGQQEFDLDQVKGLSYTYDATRQSIVLRVDDALRAPVTLSGRTVRKPGVATVTPGAVLNYDVYSLLGQNRATSISNELRYFNDSGVLTSTGVANSNSQGRQFVRFDTAWVHADPDTMETWTVGDFISSSLNWSRSLRMGGVQWKRSFDLRPDLLTFPAAALGGSAVVPSAVSLYINGVRQVETAVPSGPFIINQVAGINGAGQATLVTRDAAGRAVSTTLPLYVDTRMLAEGLTDYSFELGVLRRRYTVDSFGYARTPSASGSLRRGLSDSLTLEAHAEGGRGVLNGGGGMLWRLGQVGVVSASLSASAGNGSSNVSNTGVIGGINGTGGACTGIGGAGVGTGIGGIGDCSTPGSITSGASDNSRRGVQATLGYQYLSPRFSVDLQSQRASVGYSDLGTLEGAAGVRANDRINLNLSLFAGQGLGLSAISQRTPLAPTARVVALSYSASLFKGFFLSVSAFRDYRDAKARGVFFSISGTLGDRISASVSRNRQNDVRSTTTTLARSADYSGGFGWGLQSVNNNGSSLRQAQGVYLGNYGQASALMIDNGGRRTTSVDVAGALVLMDGSVHPARQVGAGFALVSTDGVGGVPVLQENQVIGKTSSSGYLLVPNLNPYFTNQVGIDPSKLPLDARISSTGRGVVPARLSGVLVRFPVETYEAASVILQDADGKPLGTGIEVLHVESGNSTVVGYDGMAFIDHLQPLNHLRLTVDGKPCVVEFHYEPVKGNAMPTVGPFRCQGVQ
ncbi:fimbria/pilus outer membrane usher protein [Duganella flavida]|uniref:fimbria/pilus outer membrane usher protein n=1 Tax=Duganella flavida TaxID=2692175 RepID=UPI001E429DDA|nr:fimbria/pilus outer membrane usher protein [Duganella flavida]